MFGLSTMWVHPYQDRAPTIEEAVKQLTQLPSTGSECPYALVQLNGDACYIPLPRERHLSILVEVGTSSAACRRVSQLEVHWLLSSGSQVVYLVGLNGCEVPVIASPPVTGQRCQPTWRQTHLPNGGHPAIHCRGARTQSSTPRWSLLFYPDCKPCQASSAEGGRRGQHDHGGEGAPILGSFGHI